MNAMGGSGDLNADHYKKHSALQTSSADKILRDLPIDPHAIILDVGCGDGRNTAKLAEKAKEGRVLGLDKSRSMIEDALKTFPHRTFSNLEFELSSVEEKDFRPEFDLITSFSCFHWLKKPKDVLQKLIGSLKSGGELLILTYPKESPYYKYLEQALQKYRGYEHLSANQTMLSAQEYKEFFEGNHFEILDFQEEVMFAQYQTPDEIFNFIKGWVRDYILLPEHLEDQFISEVVQTILNDPSVERNPLIKVPYTALTIRGKKP